MESKDVEFIENKFQIDSNSISEQINNSKIEIESTNNTGFYPSSRNKRIQMDHPIELRRSHRTKKKRFYIHLYIFTNHCFLSLRQ